MLRNIRAICRYATFAAIFLLLRPGDVRAQVYATLEGRLDDDARIELVVVDRYAIPIPGVRVQARCFPYPPDSPFRSAPFAVQALAEMETDQNGRCSFDVPSGAHASALLSRSGYAPSIEYPLFGGGSYRASLHLGASALFRCRTSDGQAVPGASISAYWWTSPSGFDLVGWDQLPIRSESGSDGALALNNLPRGQIAVFGHSAEHGVAFTPLQVATAFGHELFESFIDNRLVFDAPLTVSFDAVDSVSGEVVDGAEAILNLSYCHAGAPSPSITGNTVTVHGIPRNLQWSVRVWAPGYRGRIVQSEDVAAGQVGLEPEPQRLVQISYDAIDGLDAPDHLFIPVSRWRDSGWRRLDGRALGEGCATEVPSRYEVFAVVLRERTVRGYLAFRPDVSKVDFIAAARLRVSYAVGESKPIGALIRLRRLANSNGSRVAPPLFNSYIGLTDLDGVLRVSGLLPGTYELEPHFHFSVFKDSLATIELDPGSDVVVRSDVRMGDRVRGHVIDAASGEPIVVGHVTALSDRVPSHGSVFPLDSNGAFQLAGLVPGEPYEVSYHPRPWSSVPAWVRILDGRRVLPVRQSLPAERPDSIVIEVPDSN